MDDNIPDDCRGRFVSVPWEEPCDDVDYCTCGRVKDATSEWCNRCTKEVEAYDNKD